MHSSNNPDKQHSLPFVMFLVLTSLLCGALVMVIEVLGSRIIGPFFGASLYVWTSLIAVTLVGLALGYTCGGILSDRRESPDYLYGILFLAGIAVILIPVLKKPVLDLTIPLGLRAGALAASTLLFGPSLFLLGCVSPYIIKIAAREMRSIGRTVGIFYAVSTIGSFIGTVITGFILIAYFRVNQILLFVGATLMVISVLYRACFRKRPLSLLLLIPLLFIPAPETVRSNVYENGTTVTRIYEADSHYGTVKVLDYTDKNRRTRELLVDGIVQGGIDMTSRLPIFDYYYYLQYIPYVMNPQGKTCLVIGLGAGIIPYWYERMGIQTDSIDINPDVVRVAGTYFGFSSQGHTYVEDARYFLNRSTKNYDFIIFDVYNGENVPTHVLSLEALQLAAQRMNPGAVLGINLLGSLKDTFVTASVISTLQQVFKTVEIFPTFDLHRDGDIGNIEIIASNNPPLPDIKERLRVFPYYPRSASGYEQIGKKYTLPPNSPAVVLTDDYNPIDFYDLKIKEEVRRRSMLWTDRDMLM